MVHWGYAVKLRINNSHRMRCSIHSLIKNAHHAAYMVRIFVHKVLLSGVNLFTQCAARRTRHRAPLLLENLQLDTFLCIPVDGAALLECSIGVFTVGDKACSKSKKSSED